MSGPIRPVNDPWFVSQAVYTLSPIYLLIMPGIFDGRLGSLYFGEETLPATLRS